MGQYGFQKCPICAANIQTSQPIETCPACDEYIGDKLAASGDGTGINTATAEGPGLKPLGGAIQKVY